MIARVLLLVQVLAVLGLLMAGFSLILNRRRDGASISGAVARAVLLTLCAVLVDGVTFVRRAPFAQDPLPWVIAGCSTLGALIGWWSVWEMCRKKADQKKATERS